MSNNDLWCSKCKSQHHPAEDCVMTPRILAEGYMEDMPYVMGLEARVKDLERQVIELKTKCEGLSDCCLARDCHIKDLTAQAEKYRRALQYVVNIFDGLDME